MRRWRRRRLSWRMLGLILHYGTLISPQEKFDRAIASGAWETRLAAVSPSVWGGRASTPGHD